MKLLSFLMLSTATVLGGCTGAERELARDIGVFSIFNASPRHSPEDELLSEYKTGDLYGVNTISYAVVPARGVVPDILPSINSPVPEKIPLIPHTGSRRALLYVHGFQNRPALAVHTADQIASNASFDGDIYVFAWNSDFGLLGYDRAAENARQSWPHFLFTLKTLCSAYAPENISVIAHSMGGTLVTHALTRGSDPCERRLRDLIYVASDGDRDTLEAREGALRTRSDNLVAEISSKDPIVQIVSLFKNGGEARVGAYSPSQPLTSGIIDVVVSEVTEDDVREPLALHQPHLYDKSIRADIRAVLNGVKNPDRCRVSVKIHEFKAYSTSGRLQVVALKRGRILSPGDKSKNTPEITQVAQFTAVSWNVLGVNEDQCREVNDKVRRGDMRVVLKGDFLLGDGTYCVTPMPDGRPDFSATEYFWPEIIDGEVVYPNENRRILDPTEVRQKCMDSGIASQR